MISIYGSALNENTDSVRLRDNGNNLPSEVGVLHIRENNDGSFNFTFQAENTIVMQKNKGTEPLVPPFNAPVHLKSSEDTLFIGKTAHIWIVEFNIATDANVIRIQFREDL